MYGSIRWLISGAILVFMGLGLWACGGSGESEAREFSLRIEDRKLSDELAIIKVKQNDNVTLRIDSDENGVFHLHGYDEEVSVGPDGTSTIALAASATGNFKITFHPGVEEDGHASDTHGDTKMKMSDGVREHASLFQSPRLNKGDTFSFVVTQDLDGEKIPYHNHVSHKEVGTVTVSGVDGTSGRVEIETQGDGRFVPNNVTVKPNAELLWTNNSDSVVRVTSGHPPSEGDHSDHSEEEIMIASFEVYPR
jgi:hypothetical protein